MLRFGCLISVLLVVGCADRSSLQVLDVPAIEAVQDDLSHQVGIYLIASHQAPSIMVNGKLTPLSQVPRSDTDPRPPADPAELFACGRGDVAFDITSVSAQLTTTRTVTYSGEVGATIPADVVSVEPSYSGSRAIENTQKFTYNLWPLAYSEQVGMPTVSGSIDPKVEPIAATLLALRAALIGSATKYNYSGPKPILRPWKPCFRDYDREKIGDSSGNEYVLGLKVTNDNRFGLKVSIGGIVTLGASGQRQSSTGNTLTVSFGQSGLKEVAEALKRQKDACAKNAQSLECKALQLGELTNRGLVIQTETGRRRIDIDKFVPR